MCPQKVTPRAYHLGKRWGACREATTIAITTLARGTQSVGPQGLRLLGATAVNGVGQIRRYCRPDLSPWQSSFLV